MFLQYAIVPSSNQEEPFRIILIMDGSGSMSGQYPTMLAVYKNLFSGMNNVEAYQFSTQIGPLEPFFGGGTDIQIAIEHLTSILERGVPQTNICAVFVSDGDGSENIQILQARFKELQKKYSISFLSIAVGKGFPTLLSNKLRAMIHNASATLPAIIPVDSNDQFKGAFLKVKSLAVQQKQITIKNQVLRYPWAPPTNQVYPFEIVAVNMKENLIQTSTGVGSYVPNLSINLTFRFIQSSLQQLIQDSSNKDNKIQEYIQIMIEYIYAVRNLMEEKRAEKQLYFQKIQSQENQIQQKLGTKNQKKSCLIIPQIKHKQQIRKIPQLVMNCLNKLKIKVQIRNLYNKYSQQKIRIFCYHQIKQRIDLKFFKNQIKEINKL